MKIVFPVNGLLRLRLSRSRAFSFTRTQWPQQSRNQDIISETRERIEAIDELLAENKTEKRRLNQMYQRGRCEQEYFDSEWTRLERETEALQREREKAERILLRHTGTAQQLEELENIGADLQDGELTFTKKRTTLERLRTNIMMEPASDGGEQWLVVEVLGYQRRICLKNESAR